VISSAVQGEEHMVAVFLLNTNVVESVDEGNGYASKWTNSAFSRM